MLPGKEGFRGNDRLRVGGRQQAGDSKKIPWRGICNGPLGPPLSIPLFDSDLKWQCQWLNKK
jgi:hypothetical protein